MLKDTYVEAVAQEAYTLLSKDNASTTSDHIKRFAQLALYQTILFCDDSNSMKFGNPPRWNIQCQLVGRMARITTKLAPKGSKVYLRFVNNNATPDPTANMVMDVIKSYGLGGSSPLGGNLYRKVLRPLVYDVLARGNLARPLLICIITDSCPDHDDTPTFENAIIECKTFLHSKGYDMNTVRYILCQIGDDPSTTNFMRTLSENPDVQDVLHWATELETLDSIYKQMGSNRENLEMRLLELLTGTRSKHVVQQPVSPKPSSMVLPLDIPEEYQHRGWKDNAVHENIETGKLPLSQFDSSVVKNWVVQLVFKNGNGSPGKGNGFLVNIPGAKSDVILTSAHNLITVGVKTKDMRVYVGTSTKLEVEDTAYRISKAYELDESRAEDNFGAILFPLGTFSKLGKGAGFGYSLRLAEESLGGRMYVTGYRANSMLGTPDQTTGQFRTCKVKQVEYDADMKEGTSGSVVWTEYQGGPMAVAIQYATQLSSSVYFANDFVALTTIVLE